MSWQAFLGVPLSCLRAVVQTHRCPPLRGAAFNWSRAATEQPQEALAIRRRQPYPHLDEFAETIDGGEDGSRRTLPSLPWPEAEICLNCAEIQ